MPKARILVILLIIINVSLLLTCAYFYLNKDSQAPKIAFSENNTVYYPGIDTEELVKGVGATDKQDGDLSNRIVVEKIIENKDKNIAVVYYAASDYSGNVTKASREFAATYPPTAEEIQAEEEAAAEAEAAAQAQAEEEAKKAEEEAKKAEEEAKKAEEEAKKAAAEAKKAEEAKNSESNTSTDTSTQSSINPAQQAEDERQAQEAKADEHRPYIELSVSEYKVKKGGKGKIPWPDIIRTLEDDEEGYNDLYSNLVISDFDKFTAGTYPVSVYTTDKRGNKSNTVTLYVIVK